VVLRAPGIAALLAVAALAAPASAHAHQAILGTIKAPPCGGPGPAEPLAGIRVTAQPAGGGWTVHDTTGRRGKFRLDLTPGTYVVRFERLRHASHPHPRHVRLRRHEFPRLQVVYVFDCY
jgi:hypothetical protein